MEDLTNRKEAYAMVERIREAAWEIETWLDNLPSAEKTGKWIKICRGKYMCSSCGVWYTTTDEYGNIIDDDGEMKSNNYCSNCGARMVEE